MRTITSLFQNRSSEDIFIVGCGPSLYRFPWSCLDGRKTIALNDSATYFDPDYWLFSDNLTERYRGEELGEKTVVVTQPTPAYTLENSSGGRFRDRVVTFTKSKTMIVGRDDDRLFFDHTVAVAGIQLAWKLGAKRVYLLGVDAYRIEYWLYNKHWFAEYFYDDIVVGAVSLKGAAIRTNNALLQYSADIDQLLGLWREGDYPEVIQLSREATTLRPKIVERRDVLGEEADEPVIVQQEM